MPTIKTRGRRAPSRDVAQAHLPNPAFVGQEHQATARVGQQISKTTGALHELYERGLEQEAKASAEQSNE